MFKTQIALLVSGCLIAVTAAPPSIGTVRSAGEFRVDGSTVRGNATLFDGNLIETSSARSVIELNGMRITMSPDSRAKLFRDHTVFEKGTGVVTDAEKHVIEAATLRIYPATKSTLLQIEMSAPNHVAVAARNGSAEVRNGAGVLVAKLNAGMALAFDPQAGAATAVKMMGTVKEIDGKFFLTDATNNVTVELLGTDLAKYAGKTVEITGSTIPGATAIAGASQVVQVTEIKQVGRKAGAGAGSAGAGSHGTGGIGVGTTVAIIGGVAVGGTVVGLAAVGGFSGSSSVSRQ
jgi:hypothetical protein